MAWNEPGGNRNNQDPWGGGNRGRQDGPPDLDEAIKKGMDKLNRLFGGKGSSGGGGSSASGGGGIFAIVAVVLVFFLIFNSVYTVDERQQALVLRFGKYLETNGAGLHFKLPLIDRVEIREVTNIRTKVTSGQMLTEDENIVEIDLTVQYVINNLENFLMDVRDAETLLEYAIDSTLRHEVGSAEMDAVLTEGRSVLAVRVQERLQRSLDDYQAGIEVRQVNINEAQPPRAVRAAFDDVQRAKEDERRVVESAEAYRNKVLPEARGQAQRMIEESAAYKAEVISRAEGDTARFLAQLAIYKQAPEVTRERLYIDAMQNVLSSTSKVLVDVKEGNNLMYIPLDRIGSGAASREAAGAQAGLTPQDLESTVSRLIDESLSRQAATQSSRSRGR